MIDPSTDILQAVYTALNGNLSYDGVNYPVYTFAPKSESYNYVVLSEIDLFDASMKQRDFDLEGTLLIDVVTVNAPDNASMLASNSINSQILTLLIKQDLPMTSFNFTVTPFLDTSNSVKEETETAVICRRLTRLRFWIQQKTPLGINAGEVGGTDWLDSNLDEVPDLWEALANETISIVTGNGFTGNALRCVMSQETAVEGVKITSDANGGNVWEIGTAYSVSMKVRRYYDLDYGGPQTLVMQVCSSESVIETLCEGDDIITGDAEIRTIASITPDTTDFIIDFNETRVGGVVYFEVDEITITEV
jgi:hypothetical protein